MTANISQEDIDYFIALYTARYRLETKNQFIQEPTVGSDKYEKLVHVVERVRASNGSLDDFLNFAVSYYARLRFFPSPNHLLNDKLFMAFTKFQAMKRKYTYKMFAINGDEVLIFPTLETLSYSKELMTPSDKDMRLRYALTLAQQYPNNKDKDYSYSDFTHVVYAYVKLTYLNKPKPIELQQLLDDLLQKFNGAR